MTMTRSGRAENLPYSFSRWTDVPAAKWAWFRSRIEAEDFLGIDPHTGVPAHWSLRPDDVLGMTFWTKDPTNLLRDSNLLDPYRVEVHVTATGWGEVEKGAPNLAEAVELLVATAEAFDTVHWRFSPVPLLPDNVVMDRFAFLLGGAVAAGLTEVYLAFLQNNDLMPEQRDQAGRLVLMLKMAELAGAHGVRVLLCNEDRTLYRVSGLPENLSAGICARPETFGLADRPMPPSEGCGCVLAVDPFTINESCTLGCRYCYAADKSLSEKKRNTTRHLTLLK